MPSWFPGARYKRYARDVYPAVMNAITSPYDKVKGELVGVTCLHFSFNITGPEMCSFRHPGRQHPLSPPASYRNLTRIQPKKTYWLPRASLGQCIWLVLRP